MRASSTAQWVSGAAMPSRATASASSIHCAPAPAVASVYLRNKAAPVGGRQPLQPVAFSGLRHHAAVQTAVVSHYQRGGGQQLYQLGVHGLPWLRLNLAQAVGRQSVHVASVGWRAADLQAQAIQTHRSSRIEHGRVHYLGAQADACGHGADDQYVAPIEQRGKLAQIHELVRSGACRYRPAAPA